MYIDRFKSTAFLVTLFVVSALAFDASAREGERAIGGGTSRVQTLSVKAGFEPVYRPRLYSDSIQIDDDEKPRRAPHFTEVKFQHIPSPRGMEGRVNNMMMGITLDIEPIYDHYGYEIRRYMAKVGDTQIYTDVDFLKDQIRNVRKAKVIAEYWMKDIDEKLEELDAYFENSGSTAYALRTSFRSGKKDVQTFQVVLNGWINANERYLMTLLENQGEFVLEYPYIRAANNTKVQIYNALELRQTRLLDLHNFPLFIMMAY